MDRIDRILQDFQHVNRDALIPILQAVQNEIGHLNSEAIEKIGDHLHLPASKVYGLATFYNQFAFQARGKYHIRVCDGSTCHIDHSPHLLRQFHKLLGIGDGETTRDGMFSIEVVACLGACGQSPVISINDDFYHSIKSGMINDILDDIRMKNP
ncbi:MAG: NADH-quinone oxidoreductase subunit NuoE [Bacteroidales bacterium]|nr:NADH-quinone oxidoreductase subunit NuoE [Bacteroidales bacterium]